MRVDPSTKTRSPRLPRTTLPSLSELLEQNEPSLPQANFGFRVKMRDFPRKSEIANLLISCGVTAELAAGLVVVVQSIVSFMQRDDSFNAIGGTIAQGSVVVLHPNRPIPQHNFSVAHRRRIFAMHANTERAGCRRMGRVELSQPIQATSLRLVPSCSTHFGTFFLCCRFVETGRKPMPCLPCVTPLRDLNLVPTKLMDHAF